MSASILIAFLQIASSRVAEPLPPPDIETAVGLWSVFAWAVLNPATIAVAWYLGRKADQGAKLGIAGFAGALAGIALMWLAARVHLGFAIDTARAGAGVFITALPFATLVAWLGQTTSKT